jgi:hypothetical protein
VGYMKRGFTGNGQMLCSGRNIMIVKAGRDLVCCAVLDKTVDKILKPLLELPFS